MYKQRCHAPPHCQRFKSILVSWSDETWIPKLVFKLHKNRGKAKSYDEKQLEVGEFNETWLDGIDERIRKIRVTEDVSPFVDMSVPAFQ